MAKADELGRLKRFSEILVASIPAPEALGASVHAELVKAIVGCESLKGARTIVRDLLEWTQDIRGPTLAELDRRLSDAGLPTLSLMRSKGGAEFASILRRGVVASEDEYHVVNSRLVDTALSLTDVDRALAERLLAAFDPK